VGDEVKEDGDDVGDGEEVGDGRVSMGKDMKSAAGDGDTDVMIVMSGGAETGRSTQEDVDGVVEVENVMSDGVMDTGSAKGDRDGVVEVETVKSEVKQSRPGEDSRERELTSSLGRGTKSDKSKSEKVDNLKTIRLSKRQHSSTFILEKQTSKTKTKITG
jgi:hypothetical protein